MSPPRRSQERRYAHLGRRQYISVFPEGPEVAPTPIPLAPVSSDPLNPDGVANLAPMPTPSYSTSANATAETAPATDNPAGVHVPTSLKTVIPATVGLVGFFVLCLVVYQVHLCRKRRAARRARGLQPPMIVVETYESGTYSVKAHRRPQLAEEPDSPVSPVKSGGLPSSPRDGFKGSGPRSATNPILIKFPTSENDDYEKAPVVHLPALPATAATKPKLPVQQDAGWRPASRDQLPSPTASRLSTRSSSLLAARLSAPTAAAPRVPTIEITDFSGPQSPIMPPSPPPVPRSMGLPKLVTVISTFATTMPDELEVRLGETLRVLEMYADQWCLAERVGRGKRQRGVLPQFCVQDKEALVPRKRFSFVPFGSS